MAMTSARVDENGVVLVRRAASGDETAFASLVRLHHRDMTRVTFVVCGNLAMAEDAVARAWPIAWRRMGTLREPDRIRSWLVAIAANEARQLSRGERRRAVVELAMGPGPAAPSADPSRRTGDIDLANALARLEPDDRALVALRYVAGLSATELASGLGLSPSGVRTRLARLLARLRSELGDD